MMASTAEKFLSDKSLEYSFIDNFLYYGLMIGAVFQLVCIFAVVLIPKSDAEKEADQELPELHQANMPKHDQNTARRSAKHERKKRR